MKLASRAGWILERLGVCSRLVPDAVRAVVRIDTGGIPIINYHRQ